MKEFIMAAIIIFTPFVSWLLSCLFGKKKAALALICNLPYFFFCRFSPYSILITLMMSTLNTYITCNIIIPYYKIIFLSIILSNYLFLH